MNAKILLAASLTLAASSALAQEVQRAGKGEFYLSPVFTESKNYSFAGGSTAKGPPCSAPSCSLWASI